ncbi:MAG TPA: hypothetical protein VFV46_02220 [Lacibacter sp.]|nr:hypothetical protein [Lacibacter sp.]
MKFYQSPLLILAFLFFIYSSYLLLFAKGFDQLLGPPFFIIAIVLSILHIGLKYFIKSFKALLFTELTLTLLFFGWLLLKG